MKHTCLISTLGLIAMGLTPVASAQMILIDDFDDRNDDGWTRVDPFPGEPWDPAIFDADIADVFLVYPVNDPGVTDNNIIISHINHNKIP